MARGRLVVVLIAAAGLGLAVLAVTLRIPPGPRSVVLVTIDTLRADRVGAYGRTPSLTPRLDALAARGTLFEQAWVTAPLTVPSHATFLTGRLPAQHGLRTNRPRHRIPPREDRDWATLAEALRSAGCRTAAFTSASVLRSDQTGLDRGFDVYDQTGPAKPGALYETERRGAETVARALDWLRGTDGPVFLWVHLFDPHAPYDAPPPHGAGPEHAADATGYDREVAYADACLGTLLDGLAATGRGDAVVAVVSDHGEGLGEHGEATHGFLLHEATLHVPLVVAGETSAAAGGVRRADPVTTRDLAPTLLALARVAIPEGMPQTTWFGKRPETPAVLYAETLYGHDAFRWAQAFALRMGPWKVVDAGPEVHETSLDGDPRETAAVRHDGTAPLPDVPSAGAPASLRDAADLLRAGATGPAQVPSAAAATTGGGYWGGSGGGGVLLPAEENRRLPSPYARIGDLEILETGQTELAAGRADAALARFDEVAARDPANPQAQHWRGRALAALGRFADAGAAYRAALDLGWLDPACVEKGLQAWVRAGAPTASPDPAVAFLEAARGRGVPDSCMTAVFEVPLWLLRNDVAKARAAHERARSFPPTPETDRAIEQNSRLLEGLGGGR